MIIVEVTSYYGNPPLKLIFYCHSMRYFDKKGKLVMYNEKGQFLCHVYKDEWKALKYIDYKGEKHYIKRG